MTGDISLVRENEAGLEEGFSNAALRRRLIRGPLHPDLNPNFVKKASGDVESTASQESSIKDDEFNDAMSFHSDEGSPAGTETGSFLEFGRRTRSPLVDLDYEKERERPPGRLSLLPEESSEGRARRFRERERSVGSLDVGSANKVALENIAPITSQMPQPISESLTAKVTYRNYIREVRFEHRPTWLALSDKIHTLFSIPRGEVAASYIDAEGDEVTLSTQEELEAFYQDLYTGGRWKRGDTVSLIVWNLGSTRLEKSEEASTTTPRSNTPKATLDPISRVGIQQDSPPPTGTHVIMSERPAPQRGDPRYPLNSDAELHVEGPSSRSSGRTSREGENYGPLKNMSSIVSTIATEDGRHVSSRFSEPVGSRVSHRSHFSHCSPAFVRTIPSVSTPKTFAKDVSLHSPSTPPVSPDILIPPDVESIEVTEDLPMPSHDTPLVTKRKQLNPSLSSDIATLLSTLSEVVASHPELPKNVRKILQNAVDGNYWTPAQRESIHEAAGAIAESSTSLDKEGGKKVAEALGNLFRTVGQVVETSPGMDVEPNAASASRHAGGVGFTSASKKLDTKSSDARTSARRHAIDEWTRRSHGYQYGYEYGYEPRTTKPLPKFDHKTPAPRILHSYRDSVENPLSNPPSNLATAGRPSRRRSDQSNELKAQVEAAKLLYKAEKERYRAYKEEKQRKLREREQRLIEMFDTRSDASQTPPLANFTPIAPLFAPPLEPAVRQRNQSPASSDHERLPPLHDVTPTPSVPHPVRTLRRVSEPVGRRVIEQRSNSEVQIMKRIIKKLGDIGITTRAIPDLLSRVVALLPSDITTMTVAKEEKVALTLVNELLKSRRIPPIASGSGVCRL